MVLGGDRAKSVLGIFLYKLQDPLAPLFYFVFSWRGELLLAKLLTF
jgi:hypothetical protein